MTGHDEYDETITGWVRREPITPPAPAAAGRHENREH
jgi:hypothetical protein